MGAWSFPLIPGDLPLATQATTDLNDQIRIKPGATKRARQRMAQHPKITLSCRGEQAAVPTLSDLMEPQSPFGADHPDISRRLRRPNVSFDLIYPGQETFEGRMESQSRRARVPKVYWKGTVWEVQPENPIPVKNSQKLLKKLGSRLVAFREDPDAVPWYPLL
jgi:hypothetical protein